MRAMTPDDEMKQEDDREFAKFCHWLATQRDLPTTLRTLRMERRLSLREATFHAHCSAPYVYRVEHGLRTPERDTLIALCLRAYDLTVRQTDRVLLLAGYAPLHHEQRALMPPTLRVGQDHADDVPAKMPRAEF